MLFSNNNIDITNKNFKPGKKSVVDYIYIKDLANQINGSSFSIINTIR